MGFPGDGTVKWGATPQQGEKRRCGRLLEVHQSSVAAVYGLESGISHNGPGALAGSLCNTVNSQG